MFPSGSDILRSERLKPGPALRDWPILLRWANFMMDLQNSVGTQLHFVAVGPSSRSCWRPLISSTRSQAGSFHLCLPGLLPAPLSLVSSQFRPMLSTGFFLPNWQHWRGGYKQVNWHNLRSYWNLPESILGRFYRWPVSASSASLDATPARGWHSPSDQCLVDTSSSSWCRRSAATNRLSRSRGFERR